MDCEGQIAVLEEFMRRGVPLVVEKPLGRDMKEARGLAEIARRWKAPVMVSMNRRFDPGVLAAKEWLKGKGPIRFVGGRMLRNARREKDFVWGTGVHLLDLMVAVAGPMKIDFRLQASGFRYSRSSKEETRPYGWMAILSGRDGLVGMVEILPACGRTEEALVMAGEDYCVEVWTGSMHP
jgi:predicted dehydrogenase